jgi:hypothetical protein
VCHGLSQFFSRKMNQVETNDLAPDPRNTIDDLFVLESLPVARGKANVLSHRIFL